MKILNKFIALISIFMFVMQTSVIDAIAVNGYLTNHQRLSDLYFIGISSYFEENSDKIEEETFPISGSLAYDRKLKAKKKHYRGDVYIRYQQRGYAESTELTIDGKKIIHGYTYDDESGYIPQTGRYGVIAWKNEYHTFDVDDAVSESLSSTRRVSPGVAATVARYLSSEGRFSPLSSITAVASLNFAVTMLTPLKVWS